MGYPVWEGAVLMARIRTIKPQAFTSESMAAVSVHARWTFAGLWTYSDDDGRGRADARLIKGQLWPLDDDITPAVITAHLDELEREEMLCRYTVDGRNFLHVVHWQQHQSIQKRTASKLPPCPVHDHSGDPPQDREEDSGSTTVGLPESSDTTTAGNKEQGTGKKEGESATRAPKPAPPEKHRNTSTPEARIANTVYDHAQGMVAWETAQSLAKRALRVQGVSEQRVQDAMVALYDAGKPLTLQTVGQVLSGSLRLNGTATGPRAVPDFKPPAEGELPVVIGDPFAGTGGAA
jgi:hypothetical protein